MKLKSIVTVFITFVVLSVTHNTGANALDKQVVNIALIHTFSIADPKCYDPYGKNFENGFNMAWSDFKSENPNIAFNVNIRKYDIADNKLRAIDQMRNAAQSDNVAAIGYACSDIALLGGKEAQSQKIPLITPTATMDEIADIGDYVFMASFKNSYQAKVLALRN